MSMSRSVSQVLHAERKLEGGGFPVRRPFPTAAVDLLDPFLLLDEMGPVQWPPNRAIGAPDHPHRGFETVSYILSGTMSHKDSAGHAGELSPGDVQWMTAGRGVVHSEMPSVEFQKTGGTMHGFQLWVNLPAADKMIAPRYQDIKAADIPEVTREDGKVSVRVIAGEAMGKRAVIDTHTPIGYLHFTIAAGETVTQAVPRGHTAFAYVFRGRGKFGDARVSARNGDCVLFSPDGDEVVLGADDNTVELLLISGAPLNEPVARYGPFVMNTQDEIAQAVRDFRAGRMGRIEN
jgi:hypothetical protein